MHSENTSTTGFASTNDRKNESDTNVSRKLYVFKTKTYFIEKFSPKAGRTKSKIVL